jgi:uncharacterized protein YggU (UPF0235/DUF167 family)
MKKSLEQCRLDNEILDNIINIVEKNKIKEFLTIGEANSEFIIYLTKKLSKEKVSLFDSEIKRAKIRFEVIGKVSVEPDYK